MAPFERRWISIKETSDYLGGIHVQTLYDLARRGELPCAKLGGSLRIDKKRLDALLESQIERGRIRRKE